MKFAGPFVSLLAVGIIPSLPLLAAATDPAPVGDVISLAGAIEVTLGQQPGVQISHQQVIVDKGELQSTKGQFDWILGSSFTKEVDRTPTGESYPFPAVQRVDANIYGLGVQKEFRDGITIAPQFNVVDARNNLSSPRPVSQSTAEVVITVPLLRGLGVKAADAQEIAAGDVLKGQELLARYQVEQLVYQTSAAYWNCLAARRNLEVLTDVRKRAEEIYRIVKVFGKGGELDSADVDQARALVATKRSDQASGELVYFQARQALALAMGLTAKQLVHAPVVEGAFPAVIDGSILNDSIGERYVTEALDRRGDYRAAGLNIDAEQALVDQAHSNLKPSLDWGLTLGYAGYDNQFNRFRPVYAVTNNATGVNVQSTLTLQWPIANNLARGALLSERARMEIAKQNQSQSGQGVSSSVLVALQALRTTIDQYQASTEAVETYKKAVAKTQENLKAGEADLNSLIDVEDRYATAEEAQIAAIQQYALTLAQLRLFTGTLAVDKDHQAVFDVSTLTQVPFTP